MSTQQRANDLRAQISSLNGELKDTNKQVELAHDERDGLMAVNLQLKNDLDGLANEISESRKQTEFLVNQRQKLNTDVSVLQQQSLGLREEIRSLNQTKDQAEKDTIKAKERQKDEDDIVARFQLVGQELGLEIRKTIAIKENLDKEIENQKQTIKELEVKEQQTKDRISQSLTDLKDKKKELISKTRDRNFYFGQQDKSLKGQLKGLKTKERDLNIVKGRLKRMWPKNKPFPKIA